MFFHYMSLWYYSNKNSCFIMVLLSLAYMFKTLRPFIICNYDTIDVKIILFPILLMKQRLHFLWSWCLANFRCKSFFFFFLRKFYIAYNFFCNLFLIYIYSESFSDITISKNFTIDINFVKVFRTLCILFFNPKTQKMTQNTWKLLTKSIITKN